MAICFIRDSCQGERIHTNKNKIAQDTDVWCQTILVKTLETVAWSINWQQLGFRFQVSLGFQITSHLRSLLLGLVPTPSHQGNQYPLEPHRDHTWDLFFSWSLSTIYLPLYLFQPSCMQMMLLFTSRHEKYDTKSTATEERLILQH